MNDFAFRIEPAALGKVAVLMGGSSAEREVSLMSGGGVLNALRARGVDAHAFDPAHADMGELKRHGYARCFIALHGRHGEDGTVQGALELLGIPYTGPGVMASAIAMDKVMTKRIWRFEGLPTPDWRLVASSAETARAFAELGAPMIVKPSREGSTLGLTKVTSIGQCEQAYLLAARYDPEVLCEQFIDGIETTCPVLGQGAAAEALPVIRIEAPDGNYDYQNKYFSDATQYHCPSGLPEDEERELRRLVVEAFRTLGCRGWARADIMLRRSDRKPFLLEINTSPGMTGHSLVPMAARAAGISYEELCLRILADASLDALQGRAHAPG
ncbi:D-alanine--D-alanine ligase [Melaminivora alkalimesophila]|uniref:D-alanine--D-alanine ligase n=1 Tax=Melaminivora alkalimesophila TaxID=1165852 RepID=A0A317REA9_9BURK|nr:D-alanine--D-alanine ligase [Melaminivora alkalimesophila]PWW47939.1 D-alanine-D-alanine ligase [Melaminivora alkalimesophila]